MKLVTCAHLKNDDSLQTAVIVGYDGSDQVIDVYVYDKILDPNPTQIFKLQNLYKGEAAISAYNTLLTGEADQNSSVNKNISNNTALQVDLFREFAWSNGAQTLVPVSFPGLFPDLTRYQAEVDQQQVNRGQQPWKLHADQTAQALAATLLQWSPNAPARIVSGGGAHDENAAVSVKSTSPGGGTIMVALSRLEGNTNNGIWIATSVTTNGLALTSPINRDRLSSPITVTGTGSPAQSRVTVLDHLYNDIGHAAARGNGSFAVNVAYNSSFQGGAQEGIVALYSYNAADGSITAAVMLKELLSA